jgi:hypothetical protein|tara:strand:- start:11782 stop:12723 length:942 start_codon:yes stop_codon:yes gene_type:complete
VNFDRTVVPARFTAAVRENESLARYIVVDARTAPSPNTSDATARRLSLYALAPCHVVHIHSLSFVALSTSFVVRVAPCAYAAPVVDAYTPSNGTPTSPRPIYSPSRNTISPITLCTLALASNDDRSVAEHVPRRQPSLVNASAPPDDDVDASSHQFPLNEPTSALGYVHVSIADASLGVPNTHTAPQRIHIAVRARLAHDVPRARVDPSRDVARVDDDASRRARMAHDDDVDDATRCGVIHGRARPSFMGRGGKPKGGRGGRGRGRGKGGLTEEERLEKEREVRRDRARAREAAVTVTMRARVDIEPDGENDD